MVNGEQSRSQRLIGLPFTVYFTLCALRLALCVTGAAQSRVFGAGFFTLLNVTPSLCQCQLLKRGKGAQESKAVCDMTGVKSVPSNIDLKKEKGIQSI
jgi:hypothetical protein